VFINPQGTFRGKAEIRGFFATLLTEILPEGSTVQIAQQVTEGELGYLVWSAQSPAFDLSFVTDTFVIRNGAIVRQTGPAVIQPRTAAGPT
jgi:hypothetical protein